VDQKDLGWKEGRREKKWGLKNLHGISLASPVLAVQHFGYEKNGPPNSSLGGVPPKRFLVDDHQKTSSIKGQRRRKQKVLNFL
jgi:hypothetical protein